MMPPYSHSYADFLELHPAERAKDWYYLRRPYETIDDYRYRLDHQDDPGYRDVPMPTDDGPACYADGESLPF